MQILRRAAAHAELLQSGAIASGELTVLVLTSTGVKATDAVAAMLEERSGANKFRFLAFLDWGQMLHVQAPGSVTRARATVRAYCEL